MNEPVLIGPIVRGLVKALRPHVIGGMDAVIPEPKVLEPEVWALPNDRDERRNLWTQLLTENAYRHTRIPPVAAEFFHKRPLLPLTLKEGGEREFRGIVGDRAFLKSCAVMYKPGGWLALHSNAFGTGKTTFAQWHILRFLRIYAEGLADDKDADWRGSWLMKNPLPTVEFTTWRGCMSRVRAESRDRNLPSRMEQLAKADFLVLDDLVVMAAWENHLLADLLGNRYANDKRTILIAGGLKDDTEFQDIIGARPMSFVIERGAFVQVGTTTRRKSTVEDLTQSDLNEVPF